MFIQNREPKFCMVFVTRNIQKHQKFPSWNSSDIQKAFDFLCDLGSMVQQLFRIGQLGSDRNTKYFRKHQKDSLKNFCLLWNFDTKKFPKNFRVTLLLFTHAFARVDLSSEVSSVDFDVFSACFSFRLGQFDKENSTLFLQFFTPSEIAIVMQVLYCRFTCDS